MSFSTKFDEMWPPLYNKTEDLLRQNKTENSSKHCEFFDISDYLGFQLEDFFTSTCFVAIALIPPTVLFNFLVLVGIYKTPSLHSPSNILLCGLALTDLGSGVLANGTYAIIAVAYVLKLDALWCDMNSLSYILAVPFPVISYVTVGLISIDRVIALRFHLRYATIVTNSGIAITLVCFWILSFLVASSYYWFKSLMTWSTVVALGICLSICAINNAIIFRILQRHRIDINRQQTQLQTNQPSDINMAQRRKTSWNMLLVYLMFIGCFAPFLGIKLYEHVTGNYELRKTSYMALCLSYISIHFNSLLNPVFYCIKMRAIRRAVFKLLPHKVLSFFNMQNLNLHSSTFSNTRC